MADPCLQCTLPICDETDRACAFTQIRREKNVEKKQELAQRPDMRYGGDPLKQSIVDILKKLKESQRQEVYHIEVRKPRRQMVMEAVKKRRHDAKAGTR